jgi:hypothetical protein
MRTVVECAVSAALAGKRIVEIVRAIWVLGAVILLRVVSVTYRDQASAWN